MGQSQATTSLPPPEPRIGQDAIVYLRDLRKWLIKSRALPGAGMTSTQTGTGRVLSALDQGQSATPPHPWQIQKAGGLGVNMVDGILFSSAVTTAYSVPQSVTTATITLPNTATTKIWLKAEVSNTPWATFFALWTVDAVTVESGATLPTDTLDLSDLATGAGDVFILIAEVTTADGAVTEITQLLKDPYTLIFPLAIDVGPFECPPEEEPAP